MMLLEFGLMREQISGTTMVFSIANKPTNRSCFSENAISLSGSIEINGYLDIECLGFAKS